MVPGSGFACVSVRGCCTSTEARRLWPHQAVEGGRMSVPRWGEGRAWLHPPWCTVTLLLAQRSTPPPPRKVTGLNGSSAESFCLSCSWRWPRAQLGVTCGSASCPAHPHGSRFPASPDEQSSKGMVLGHRVCCQRGSPHVPLCTGCLCRSGDAGHDAEYWWQGEQKTFFFFKKGIFLDPLGGREGTRSPFSLGFPGRKMGIVYCSSLCGLDYWAGPCGAL